MKKRLIVHIGMGKTGTTALQHFFSANRSALKAHDISYPKYGRVHDAHHLLSPHRPDFFGAKWKYVDVEEWAPVLAKEPQGTVLISSELFAWSGADAIENLCRVAGKFFDVSVAIYLRRQDDIIMASYSQQVKAGTQIRRIDKIFEERIGNYGYSAIVARWEDQLGQSQMVVRPYEKQQLVNSDIRCDFLQHVMGLDDHGKFTFPTSQSNPRLSVTACEYKRLLNNVIKDRELGRRFNKLLLQFTASEREGGINQNLLSLQQRELILDRCREGNEAIAARYPTGEDAYFSAPAGINGQSEATYELSPGDAERVSIFLSKRNRRLMRQLSRQLEVSSDSATYLERTSAEFLKDSLPAPESLWSYLRSKIFPV